MEKLTPPAEAVEGAWNTILQYGAVGAMLVIVLAVCLFLMRYVLKYAKDQISQKDAQLAEKDKYIAEIQEKRVGVAEESIRVMTTMANQMGRILQISDSILRALEHKAKPSDSTRILPAAGGRSPGGSDDTPDDQ